MREDQERIDIDTRRERRENTEAKGMNKHQDIENKEDMTNQEAAIEGRERTKDMTIDGIIIMAQSRREGLADSAQKRRLQDITRRNIEKIMKVREVGTQDDKKQINGREREMKEKREDMRKKKEEAT